MFTFKYNFYQCIICIHVYVSAKVSVPVCLNSHPNFRIFSSQFPAFFTHIVVALLDARIQFLLVLVVERRVTHQ